jgi:hypothetical protein
VEKGEGLWEWTFDGYPIGRSLLGMMLHCLAHEIVHALLNACCSRNEDQQGEVGEVTNLSKEMGFFAHEVQDGDSFISGVSGLAFQLNLSRLWASHGYCLATSFGRYLPSFLPLTGFACCWKKVCASSLTFSGSALIVPPSSFRAVI